MVADQLERYDEPHLQVCYTSLVICWRHQK